MRISRLATGAFVLLAAMGVPGTATPKPGASLATRLEGSWEGWGSIRLADGSSDRMRCRAVYRGPDRAISQGLLCQGRNYRIDGTGRFEVTGGSVIGSWTEAAFGVGGRLSGKASTAGLNLALQGPAFSASYRLRIESCRHSIEIVPRGSQVERVAVTLRNC